MPRRRMLDPSFFDDTDVAELSRDERLFLLGCLRNADDDGRLNAHPAYLKAEIFMYDADIDLERMSQILESTLGKMASWRQDNPWRLVPYANGDHHYLYFPLWQTHQKPSHPTPSKLPAPSDISGESPEELLNSSVKASEEPPESVESYSLLGQSRSVKSRLGKSSIGQVSAVQEDFTKFLDSENDLTDRLLTTLTTWISSGRERALAGNHGQPDEVDEAVIKAGWGIPVLKKLWKDGTGEDMPQPIFEGAHAALKKYPLPVLAKAFAKGVRYQGGKHKSWKYMQAILDEEMAKPGSGNGRGRSPPGAR